MVCGEENWRSFNDNGRRSGELVAKGSCSWRRIADGNRGGGMEEAGGELIAAAANQQHHQTTTAAAATTATI